MERDSNRQTPNVMNLLAVGSSEKRNAEEEAQAVWMAEYLSSQPTREEHVKTNDTSSRLLAIALFLENWKSFGPTPENKFLRAVYAFDTLKMMLGISFDQAKILTISEIRGLILVELMLVDSHFLGCDRVVVANIGKEKGAKAAIAVVDRIFEKAAVKFGEKLRRLAAELEVVLSVSEPDDKKDDTKKMPKKKRRMNQAAIAVARIYKRGNAKSGKMSLEEAAESYVDDHPKASAESIVRTLNDNPEEWRTTTKSDKKTTR